jgi:lactate racemase
MLITFPYPGYEGIAPVSIPDDNLLGVFGPRTLAKEDPDEIVSRALAQPIGAPRLRDCIPSGAQVLILVDDGTRGTPTSRILPHVIRELEEAEVSDDRIVILTAQGTHRRMSDEELQIKLGSYHQRFRVEQHDWLDTPQLHDFGTTTDGTRVRANRLLFEADFVMGIGSIVPHRIKGFSGGAKIVVPGVAGREIQDRNQWEAAQVSADAIMGAPENPIRQRCEEAARLVGLKFIVNCVSDASNQMVGCFAGDVVAAHREGCKLAATINGIALPRRAEIVLIDSHPADRDVWQSAKAVYAGSMAVRHGGTLIVVSPNPEGVASNHPIMLEIGYRPFPQLKQLVQAREVSDLVGVSILADLAQVFDRVECVLVSPGVTEADAKRIGFDYSPSVQGAFDLAMSRLGTSAKIAVLRRGGHVLPRLMNGNRQ